MTDMNKPKQIAATKAELVEIIRDLLYEFEGWTDGCGCCSSMCGKDAIEFKKAAQAINY